MVHMAHGARRWSVVAAVVALVVAAGCSADSGRDIDALQNPTRTTMEPYVEPHFDDTRDVTLAPVPPGAPLAFPVSIRGGDASLAGTLVGPEGPVPRGRVRLERFVGETSAVLEVVTNAQGRWNAKGILGGRYRVRGWRTPDLAMNSSTVLFLGAEEDGTVDLEATGQVSVDVQAALLTPIPPVDAPVTVTALITRHEVDGEGVVQGVPLTGRVATLASGAGWEIAATDAIVDGAGGASWTVTCTALHPGDLVVSVDEAVARVPVPVCIRPVAPTTSTTVSETPVADFAVGARFTPPFSGPLPAGTYTVVGDAASCGLVYEVWEDGGWSADQRTSTATSALVLDTFARNLDTLGDAPACTYERAS